MLTLLLLAPGLSARAEGEGGGGGGGQTGSEGPQEPTSAEETAEALPEPPLPPFELLGEQLEPGTRRKIALRTTQSFIGAPIETPVIVAAGTEPGGTLCIVAGIHGDEVNGVEIVRRFMLGVDPESLTGNIVAVPIANVSAFRRGSRYLPDRRDLNRYFPGSAFGSSASRIAYGLFSRVIVHCDAVVDIHTGSFHRTNLHQLRADVMQEGSGELAHAYSAEVVVNNPGRLGTLRRAATDAGIPAITVEAGEPSRFDRSQVEQALRGLARLVVARGMKAKENGQLGRREVTVFQRTSWVRCDQGGILVSRIGLGDQVEAGEALGTISDPLSGDVQQVLAPHNGRVIGMAVDQLVMPGFAAYHIGLRPSAVGGALEAEAPMSPDPSMLGLPDDPMGVELDERPE
ncbi:MAG: succinylglutamate desuccinylase/aspartoacylase family protein [Deltaproteobacteria bacterium]|jgi:predicted deacylase|nr:succinylglutamate desuccinylase/aspartoacylase family protein [Deltaproteobacteria bacterium]